MRVLDFNKKSGFFWLPENFEKKIPGDLVVSDGGSIELSVLGNFDEGLDEAFEMRLSSARILGFVEDEGVVTLDGCAYIKKQTALGGIGRSKIRVQSLLCGGHYEVGEVASFNQIDFHIEGLDEWLNITGISVERDYENRTATINYVKQHPVALGNFRGFEISIGFAYSFPGAPILKEAKITHGAYLSLKSIAAQPLQEFTVLIYQLTNFFGFAMNAKVSSYKIAGYNDTFVEEIPGGGEYRIPVKVFLPLRPLFDEVPQVIGPRMLFSYRTISQNAAIIFKCWLEAYEEILPALSLYFSVVQGTHRYADSKFLALAQGLETYHRRTSNRLLMDSEDFQTLKRHVIDSCPEKHRSWLDGKLKFANEISLAHRLKDLIEPNLPYLPKDIDQKRFVRQVVDTRNYLTHYSEELKDKAAHGRDLVELILRLEVIFVLSLIRHIGFTEAEVAVIMAKNHDLRQRLKPLD